MESQKHSVPHSEDTQLVNEGPDFGIQAYLGKSPGSVLHTPMHPAPCLDPSST